MQQVMKTPRKDCARPNNFAYFLTQVVLLAIWKTLCVVTVPLGKILAAYIWAGKSFCKLSVYVERQLLKAVGWLSNPAFDPYSNLGRVARHSTGVDVRRWQVGVAALVATGVIHRLYKTWSNAFDEKVQRAQHFRRLMAAASSYEQWKELAQQLFGTKQLEASAAASTQFYDAKLLREKTTHLQRVRQSGKPKEMMFALRIDLMRNIANISKSLSPRDDQPVVQIPEPIQQYLQEVKEQLEELTSWPEHQLPVEEKLAFLRETRHTFGRTALLLSGGGSLGTFHIGVVKALFERQLLPRVLAGSSVGSIVCAIVASKTDEELAELFTKLDRFDVSFFNNSRAVDLVQNLMTKGVLHDISFLVTKLRNMLGDLTFQESYERTGRILNITVCPADTNEPPRLLNYLTAPHVLIWSAVSASAAFPGLFHAQELLAKNSNGDVVKVLHTTNSNLQRRWRDGSLEFDLPAQALGEMFHCNHFLVSQTNPHIVPLLNLKRCFSPEWAKICEAELKHRCQVLQWMLPRWFPSKWLSLFTQPWEGDVTMILPGALWKVAKTVMNPTTPELMRSVKVGEVAIWEKLAAIQCNCSVEAILDKCLSKVQGHSRGRNLRRYDNRIPSWLHMSNVDFHTIASWADAMGDADNTAHASWGPDDMAAAAAAASASPRSQPFSRAGASAADAVAAVAGSHGRLRLDLPTAAEAANASRPRHSLLQTVLDEEDPLVRFDSGELSRFSVSHAGPKTSIESAANSSAAMSDARLEPSAEDPMLHLAHMDCTDPTATDLWSCFLPLAQTSVGLGQLVEESMQEGAADADDLPVY